MCSLLISDIWLSIFNTFGNMKEIIQLELLSKYHQHIIRTHVWNIEIFIKNDKILEHIINNYKMKNMNINRFCDVNIFIDELKNCHTLDISCTNITDASVSELKNCHTLDLRRTNITDASVSELKNCHTLYLYETKITDECVNILRSYGCIVHK